MQATDRERDFAAALLWWRLSDRKTRVLLAALALFLAVMAGFSAGAGLSGRPYGDFFALWTFARFSLSHPAARIYDLAELHRFQRLYAPTIGWMPFAYPPFFLLLLAPFGLAPIGLAWAAWSAAGAGAYLASVFAGRWRSSALGFVALAPASVVSLISGQSSLLCAGLIIGGTRLMARRPLLAGALFGLSALKPQIGLLIPIALVAARAWRCLGAAAASVVALGAATTLAFGPSIWQAWIEASRRQWDQYVLTGNETRLKMPTITASLELAGVGASQALCIQFAGFIIAGAIVWILFRRRTDRWAIAVLLVGGMIATPYALVYDLPTVTFAILLAVSQMAREDRAWNTAEASILLLAFLAPYAPFLAGAAPIQASAVVIVLLFAVLARRALARQPLDAGPIAP
jgi:hypothetical protein